MGGFIVAQNGRKLITFVGSLLGSFLAVTYAIYQLVYAPLTSALATECDKRETNDKEIRVLIDTKMDKLQSDITDIKVALAHIIIKKK